MSTGTLSVNRDIVLASKHQTMRDRQKQTPMPAVLALAQMQRRPLNILNYASDGDEVTLIAQITRTEIYDPVTSALQCVVEGADAIAFFTDHAVYAHDLDDMLMVARGVQQTPVIYQNYILDEYGVMSARAADASALIIQASLLEPAMLRRVVSMTQRWKMSALVQVNTAKEFDAALELSPHALCFGDHLSGDIESSIHDLLTVRDLIPPYIRVLLMHTLYTLNDVTLALDAGVDALIVSQDLFKTEKSARRLRGLISRDDF